MKNRSRRHAALLAAVATLTLAGCGYFTPREPEDPQPPPPRHAPTTPESVLYNFEVALEYKVVGAPQLSEALDLDFLMLLDVDDSRRLNGLEEIFKQDFERANRDFLSLRVQGNELDLVFLTDESQLVSTADTAYYQDLPYSIVIYPPAGSGSDTLELITGVVDLGFKLRTNWAIRIWDDSDVSGDGARHETYGYYMGFYSGLTAPGDQPK